MVLSLGCAAGRGATSGGGSSWDVDRSGTVLVRNRTLSDFAGLRAREMNGGAWGPQRLGRGGLRGGRDVLLRSMPCGHYDLQLVGARGATCELRGVAVCQENYGFTVTPDDLARCADWR